MIPMIMKREIGACVLEALKAKPLSFAELREIVKVHDVPLTIAIRDLQNSCEIEHGYLAPDGQWIEDYFPDENLLSAGWRVCENG